MRLRREMFAIAGACVAAIGATPARAVPPLAPPAAEHFTAGLPARRHRELDDLRRRDAARDLEARGVATRWEDHELAELLDWRERIDAARALQAEFGVEVDWRMESAAALVDMRLCAAKAAELQASFGIVVDWRRYTWAQIERLRLSLVSIQPPETSHAKLAAAPRDRDALAPFDPNRRAPRPTPSLHDPDAIVAPLFASETSASRSHAAGGQMRPLDPDAILAPTFARHPPRPIETSADTLLDPWRTR